MNMGYELIYKEKNLDKFWSLFDSIKSQYNFIGSRYHPIVLDQYLIRAEDSGYTIKDMSCILTFNGQAYMAFLGALFSKGLDSTLSLFEVPCLVIDSMHITSKQKKQIRNFLKSLLELDFDNFLVKGPNFHNSFPVLCELMLHNNAKLNISASRIIDLKQDEIELKKSLRKSYHSLINWGLKEMKIQIFDKNNISWEVMDKFRTLHISEAKRETRSIRTWKKQLEAIERGLAFCITAELKKELVSAAFFSCANNLSYYGSSASRRDLFEKPITHALIWQAILESKKKGASFFDIGTTYLNDVNSQMTEKEKNIAYFKDGFGGKLTLDYYINIGKLN